ncbi:rhomboid family intramembrane serine protease [Defluviimonas sp. SAOS-178_SWC]|uniref:rhomboid family intramembrane serine protease n=1 Tax=Defluviimonas sp. SAOS-178_SWC TaxID=3121287 RepID=UPI0032220C72
MHVLASDPSRRGTEMTSHDERFAGSGRIPRAVWIVVSLSVLPELILQGADLDLWGRPGWRSVAYEYAGFWAGLLGDWRPNYTLQPILMFVTYGFLHAGIWHLVLNMTTLLALTPPLVAQVGTGRFLALYGVSILGGAVGFAALTRATAPMVGASGALFGLVGALMSLDFRRRIDTGRPVAPLAGTALALILGNALVWWATNGRLAWETHLGGFLAGWIAAMAVPDRRADRA